MEQHEYYILVKHILNIGLDRFNGSIHELKIRKLYNGVSFFGIVAGIVQVFMFYQQDPISSLLHTIWSSYCILALYIHSRGYFEFAKVSSTTMIMVCGGLASMRIGAEYYPHIASFGILAATFIFFDIKKEWYYIVFFMLLHVSTIVMVELGVWRSDTIIFSNPTALRITLFVGTAIFLAFEILAILRLSWLSEKSINANLKKTNTELKQINEEKTVMLQEIHHRVKNNLQVVISLIKLQTKSVEDKQTIAIFEELKMRLISIARMHEMMYLSEKINKIDFQSYVQELSEMVLESTDTTNDVELNVYTNVKSLSAEGVVPLALILNELVTNSIKHAFDGRKNNKITISFKMIDNNSYLLEYSDNGKWKEKKESSSGFGLELIELLAEQLEGSADRTSSEDGTKYRFELII